MSDPARSLAPSRQSLLWLSLALLAVLEPATHTGRYLGFVLFDVVLLLAIGLLASRAKGHRMPI